MFTPYVGKWSNLTNIFQMGWNHQLVYIYIYIHIQEANNLTKPFISQAQSPKIDHQKHGDNAPQRKVAYIYQWLFLVPLEGGR